jgi:hypothetical protein
MSFIYPQLLDKKHSCFVVNVFYLGQTSHKTSVVANPVSTPPTTSMGV